MQDNPYASPTGKMALPAEDPVLHRLYGRFQSKVDLNGMVGFRAVLKTYFRPSMYWWTGMILVFLMAILTTAVWANTVLIWTGTIGVLACLAVSNWCGLRQGAIPLSNIALQPDGPIELELTWQGLRLLAPTWDQFSIWQSIGRDAFQEDVWISVISTIATRHAIAVELERIEPSCSMRQLEGEMTALRMNSRKRSVSGAMIDPVQERRLEVGKPIVTLRGQYRIFDVFHGNWEAWRLIQLNLVAMTSFQVFIGLWFFAWIDQLNAFGELKWIMSVFFFLFVVWKLRRAIYLLFVPNAIVSDFEFMVCENGIQSRSNATHTRVLWNGLRDLEVKEDGLYAKIGGGKDSRRLLTRKWFESEADWDRSVALAFAGSQPAAT